MRVSPGATDLSGQCWSTLTDCNVAKDVLRAVKQRVAERVRFVYAKARHAAAYADDQEALRRFRRAWMNTGVARECKGVACLALFNMRPTGSGSRGRGVAHPARRGVHAGTRQAATSIAGWALTAHDVGAADAMNSLTYGKKYTRVTVYDRIDLNTPRMRTRGRSRRVRL